MALQNLLEPLVFLFLSWGLLIYLLCDSLYPKASYTILVLYFMRSFFFNKHMMYQFCTQLQASIRLLEIPILSNYLWMTRTIVIAILEVPKLSLEWYSFLILTIFQRSKITIITFYSYNTRGAH